MSSLRKVSAVLARVLAGESLKTLCHDRRATYAMICETIKRRPLLERALASAGLSDASPSTSEHAERLLLAHEVLFGHGLRREAARGLARGSSASDALRILRTWHGSLLRAAKSRARPASGGDDDIGSTTREVVAPALPRYARVNTLKSTVSTVCAALQREGFCLCEPPTAAACRAPAAREFWVDPLVPTLLVLPAGTELHTHALVQSAALVLQDKASCMAPVALSPPPGSLVIDTCAAPGNKTSQLAALAAPGRVIACERDPKRAATLTRRTQAATGDAVRVLCTDFLQIDPASADGRDT
eukprot:4755914-Prymnesium_polylepis.1